MPKLARQYYRWCKNMPDWAYIIRPITRHEHKRTWAKQKHKNRLLKLGQPIPGL